MRVGALQFGKEQPAVGGGTGVDVLDAVIEGVAVDEAAREGEVAGGRFAAVRKAGKLLVRQEAQSCEVGPRWARPLTTRLRAGGSGPRAGRR
ncbi:hypothetical protein GCM10010497_08070 [Streptomyces cinereoruber]|uniref:Uncharacterized protein n=1 Tax=Streptomyces cinereoruber TaxID=67260 RepID=A0AAV4KGX1_9ACTN|nr:hypothetical protein GCM10010497_08070 [Streptomyces cinereoruber]